MTMLRILTAGLLCACWLVLLAPAGSEARSCSPEQPPSGHAYVSYSDRDDPQSWGDHRTKIDPAELRGLCVERSSAGSGSTGDDGRGEVSAWALVGGAGVVAAGSTVLALRRRPG